MSGSTATATTVTAEASPPPYVGRFAPSPTGPLHLGSLIAALGSFLDARRHAGRWLLRMEDLDRERVVPGCADEMLRTLEAHGLSWDGTVEYQSTHVTRYGAALAQLTARGRTFECSCTRRERTQEGGYPGTCRSGPRHAGPTATRFRVDESTLSFEDRVQGHCRFSLRERGDVVVRRRDGVFAYQLAVVVDDAHSAITDVVRGADLLDNTPWQIALQHALGLPPPRYAHLPLIVEARGTKLSKSRRSLALDPAMAGSQLYQALTLLRQTPSPELKLERPAAILEWAVEHWRLDRVQGVREVLAGD
ncbi:MAG TPA: tRNA glutamyl-Q(34) synthetase GluQRS [Steroidobacteraceae bacterium]|nr:tRNA glutamyl-Q(34) synthetase GluQRS [Steroidobacteraceae bacterium]